MIKNQDELENKTAKFDGAVMLLPYKLREAARSLTKMEGENMF